MGLKIKTFGARAFTCSLPLMEEAFISLGHEITDKNPDIVYSIDIGGYAEALEFQKTNGGKLVFNALDIPFHVPEIQDIINKYKFYLPKADIITCISKAVQKDLLNLGFESYVIYNPVRPVSYLGIKTSQRPRYFCAIGRLNDPNKRFNLIKESIQHQYLDVFGSEFTGFGNYFGIVSDETLNKVYNNTRFCLITSKNEGCCMPLLESIINFCQPVVCHDMSTATEFCPQEFLCEPTPTGIRSKIEELYSNQDYYQELLVPYAEKYKEQFSPVSIAKNIISLCQ